MRYNSMGKALAALSVSWLLTHRQTDFWGKICFD